MLMPARCVLAGWWNRRNMLLNASAALTKSAAFKQAVPMDLLIIFLGNPGKSYEKTRHNIARMLLPYVLREGEFLFGGSPPAWKTQFHASYTVLRPAPDRRIHLLEPDTFMNSCGKSAAAAVQFLSLNGDKSSKSSKKNGPKKQVKKTSHKGNTLQSLLVVHDDLELPFGTLAIKEGGGAGGHNGLRSIISSLGTKDFFRLRLGIGRPERGDVSSFVLSRFTPIQEALLADFLPAAARELLNQLASGTFTATGKREVFRSP